ncbi:MAG: hypothetical protein AAF585_05710 [Verrucomicrobiota bacterium]
MKTKDPKPRLGLDFGKVIMGAVINGKADTSFLGTSFEDAMKSPATEGAVEAVAELVDRFEGEVWIVSKCGPSVENKTKGWLKHHDFYGQTGLQRKNLRFCRKRPDKAPICKQLRITHFVDDRADVLQHMIGVVPNLFLFGEQCDHVDKGPFIPANTWESVLDLIPAQKT